MNESNWTNPHGLPDPAQYTTARDMAILGRALIREFPEHRGLFQLSAVKLGLRRRAHHQGRRPLRPRLRDLLALQLRGAQPRRSAALLRLRRAGHAPLYL